jgi:hypothetical protein
MAQPNHTPRLAQTEAAGMRERHDQRGKPKLYWMVVQD